MHDGIAYVNGPFVSIIQPAAIEQSFDLNSQSVSRIRMIYNAVFVEQWIEYALGTTVFLLRIYSQLARVGWRKFQVDDILIVLCVVRATSPHVFD